MPKVKRAIGEFALFPGVFIEETQDDEYQARILLSNWEYLTIAIAKDLDTLAALVQDYFKKG